jgi:HlyD family secretion protein
VVSAPSIFRAEAQAHLQRPDQLATGLRLVSPAYAATVAGLGFIVLAAILGAAFVRVPISVGGTGVILSSKGVLEFTIAAEHEGKVTDMRVDVGQHVTPGQVIAQIVQPALVAELKLAQSELDLIDQEDGRVRSLQAKVTTLSDGVRRQQEANSREAIGLLEQRLALLERMSDGQDMLRRNGDTTLDRVLRIRADLADVRERLASKRSESLGLTLESNEKQAQYERELQALQTRRAQAERQISRLQDRIHNETVVRSTQDGIVSEVKVYPGDLIHFDTPLISLLPVDESFTALRPGQAHLVAEVLIPAKDGKKVQPGMHVLVEPTSVRRDVYGAVEGVVTQTSDVAASPEQLRHMLRNDDLVRKLTAAGPPFLSTVEMTRDPRTKTGLRWTTSAGPDTVITAGTLLEARVMTERVSILGLLIPAVKELLRGPD